MSGQRPSVRRYEALSARAIHRRVQERGGELDPGWGIGWPRFKKELEFLGSSGFLRTEVTATPLQGKTQTGAPVYPYVLATLGAALCEKVKDFEEGDSSASSSMHGKHPSSLGIAGKFEKLARELDSLRKEIVLPPAAQEDGIGPRPSVSELRPRKLTAKIPIFLEDFSEPWLMGSVHGAFPSLHKKEPDTLIGQSMRFYLNLREPVTTVDPSFSSDCRLIPSQLEQVRVRYGGSGVGRYVLRDAHLTLMYHDRGIGPLHIFLPRVFAADQRLATNERERRLIGKTPSFLGYDVLGHGTLQFKNRKTGPMLFLDLVEMQRDPYPGVRRYRGARLFSLATE